MLLIKDKELKREVGKAARKKLEKEYSLSAHCAQLMVIYKDLSSGC